MTPYNWNDELGDLPEAENEFSIPDMSDCVVGFRAWSWLLSGEDGEYRLNAGQGAWEPGVNIASCKYKPHKAPKEGCSCGYYVYHDLERFETNSKYGMLYGIVAAWGELLVKRDGVKAEKVEIVALTYDPRDPAFVVDIVEEAAKVYDVPVVKWAEAESFALQFGSPVPPQLYPGGKKASKKVSHLVQKVPEAVPSKKPKASYTPASGSQPMVVQFLGNKVYREADLSAGSVPILLITWLATLFIVVGVLSGTPGGLMVALLLALPTLVGWWSIHRR